MAAVQPLKRTEGTTRRGYSAGRFYELPDGRKYPSVTNILSCIGKPALINWAAKEERLMVIEAATNLYDDAPASPKMSRLAFSTTLETRLGKEKAHRKKLREAADIGTQAHAWIEWTLRKELGQVVNGEPILTDRSAYAVAQWVKWRETVNLEPIFIEQTVYSDTNEFAGTLDLGANLTWLGRRLKTVLDWKTGKSIYWEALLQNTAYAHAIVEMKQWAELPAGLIVRLPKVETDPPFDPADPASVFWISPERQAKLMPHFLHVRGTWQAQQDLDGFAILDEENLV